MKTIKFSAYKLMPEILLSLLINLYSFSQTLSGMSYQAVLRDASGNIRTNENVSLEIQILQGTPTGTTVFSETHNATTNNFGLVNLKIGSIHSTEFKDIDWANGPYFIQIQLNGTVMGTSQLLSVPYALHAKTAESVDITGNEAGFENWDKNQSDDVLVSGNQTIAGSKSFSEQINSKGIALPYSFGPNPEFVGDEGAYIGFGHNGVSEDFIGYKNNTIYFKDSPGGGDVSDPNIVVGGNVGIGIDEPKSKLSVGDEGSSDIGIAGRDTRIGVYGKSDETHSDGGGVVGENENGRFKGYLGGQNCGVKSDGDLVVENGRFRGNIGPQNGAPYPMPAYNSGWKPISKKEIITLNHNIGGNVNNYVIELSFKDPKLGIHNRQMGGDFFKPRDENWFGGAYYFDLTPQYIKVHRFDHDYRAPWVRIRI